MVDKIFSKLKKLGLPRNGRVRAIAITVLVISIGGYTFLVGGSSGKPKELPLPLSKLSVSAKINMPTACSYFAGREFDSTLAQNGLYICGADTYMVNLTLDSKLQSRISTLFIRNKPVCGAAVVFRPATGEVLAAVSYRNPDAGNVLPPEKNMLAWSGFPAASLFKIVTASGAIDNGLLNPEDRVCISGRFYTLYKSQLEERHNRWSKLLSVREAFARSVNPVFGKIGLRVLGEDRLNQTAQRFLFNTPIPFDVELPVSRYIPPADDYELAQTSCGFTRNTTITPLHAAMLAGAMSNGGTVMRPYLVRTIAKHGTPVYSHISDTTYTFTSRSTAFALQSIMHDVVRTGTARKGFRTLAKTKLYQTLNIGGKTGSLNAELEQGLGRCDWFSGFALNPDAPSDGIAFAIVMIHGKRWNVHSAAIGAEVVQSYFDHPYSHTGSTALAMAK